MAGRAFWLIIAAVAAGAVFSGYAAGAFVINSFQSVPAQSAAWAAPPAPPGISYPFAKAELVNATTLPAAGGCTTTHFGNLSSPIPLTNGTVTPICLTTAATGYAMGDVMYVYEITWNHSALASTTFEVQVSVDVVPATNDVVANVYVATSATITVSESAIFSIDMIEAGDTSVVTVTPLITQL